MRKPAAFALSPSLEWHILNATRSLGFLGTYIMRWVYNVKARVSRIGECMNGRTLVVLPAEEK